MERRGGSSKSSAASRSSKTGPFCPTSTTENKGAPLKPSNTRRSRRSTNICARMLAEEEMDLSYSDEPWDGGGILIRGRLKHLPGGHFEDSFMPAPLDTTGGKSNVQAVGSTNSFLRRYVACNIFNIVVVGDDDDGTGGPIDEAQTKTIVELIKKAKVGPKFLKYVAGPERRGSRLAGGGGGDDRRPRLSQGRQHARGTDRQDRGRSCPSFMM